ncbi:MAG: hypothetical protein ABFS42_04300 [Candidatus Krumholzibacteriota bacterium]
MKILMTLAILMVSAAGFFSPIQACVPTIEMIQDYSWDPPGPISFCVLPDGEVRIFSYLSSGQEINPVLHFRVESWTSDPPFPYVHVELLYGPEVICGINEVVLSSDSEGWVTWTPEIQGGGHREPGEATHLLLAMMGFCPNQHLELLEGVYFNSPDITGDLKVDLADVQLFAGDFFGSYDYRSDFNADGLVNLSDLPFMAQNIGSACR